MNVLLTGGAGYIGSHTAVELYQRGFTPVIVDDFSNSHPEVLNNIQRLTGKKVNFEKVNVLETLKIAQILIDFKVDAVIHFAASKSIGESVQDPLKYYKNNVCGMISVLEAMKIANCNKLVHSSSCVVYGNLNSVPIKEKDAILGFTNPYGQTKLICENLIQEFAKLNPYFKYGILRYFNPAGAHESGLIGENPRGIPNNLLPYISQVAAGKLPTLKVFGNDYPTKDGTGVRDYIHVMDLAEGHVYSLNALIDCKKESHIVNLGTGRGYSVLDVIRAFENANNVQILFEIVGRRKGDLPEIFADASLAKEILGWKSHRTIKDICLTYWKWQKVI